jgi:hypothetical protein
MENAPATPSAVAIEETIMIIMETMAGRRIMVMERPLE